MSNYLKSVKEQVRQYIKDKVEVCIYPSDEVWCGDIHFVIEVIDSNGFWLTAFKKKETAIKFCNKFGLKIV